MALITNNNKSFEDKLLQMLERVMNNQQTQTSVTQKLQRGHSTLEIQKSQQDYLNKILDKLDQKHLDTSKISSISDLSERIRELTKFISDLAQKASEDKKKEFQNLLTEMSKGLRDIYQSHRNYNEQLLENWKNLSIQEKEEILKSNLELTREQVKQHPEREDYKQQEKEDEERYESIRRVRIQESSWQDRASAYKKEQEEIKRWRKEQKAINRIENKDDEEERKKRDKEINKETKTRLAALGVTFGSAGKLGNFASGASSVASVMSGGLSGIMGAIDGALGSASPIINVIQSILKVVNGINQLVAKGVQNAVGSQTAYMGSINTRLQKLGIDTTNYYNEMIDWSTQNQDAFGVAIGNFNAFVDKQKYIEQLNKLVQQGIAYNAEERALLSTIADRLVTTFDVMDANLTRLVRLQQRDMTYTEMGAESLLTRFLNTYFEDTSYLTNQYDEVRSIILDATAKMDVEAGTAFAYEIQKWLGSLYSLGLSESGVQQLAKGITYLATGNISELTSNQQLQYIYAAAAEKAGMSLGDILVQGLDVDTTNKLLLNVVTLLQDIYDNSNSNVVQSAWTTITGMSISDLRAITNVSNDYLAAIDSSHTSWKDTLEETTYQLSQVETDLRTSTAMSIENMVNNALFNVGQKLIDQTYGHGIINSALGIAGMSKYLGYYIGNSIGGSIGTILSLTTTLKPLIETMQEFFNEGNIAEKNIDSKQARNFFQERSTLENLLSSYQFFQRKYPLLERNSPGVSSSSYIPLFEDVADQTAQLVWDISLQSADAVTSSMYDEYSRVQDQLASSQANLINTSSLASPVVNAQRALQNAQPVSNASEADKALIDNANEVQNYLFENEKTIRITLAELETKALNELKESLKAETIDTTIKEMLAILRDKINVDIVDSDVNAIMNNIYQMKWQS